MDRFFFKEIPSTNDFAKEILRQQSPSNPVLIRTHFQTKGKGQFERSWESEAGKNVLMTLLVENIYFTPRQFFTCLMKVALACIEWVHQKYPSEILKIKCPNDLYAGEKKIGGILIENIFQHQNWKWIVIGIGINVNQRVFGHPQASSLKGVFNVLEDLNVDVIPEEIAQHILAIFKQNDLDCLKRYNQYLYRKDEEVFIKDHLHFTGQKARVEGVLANGKVEVKMGDETCQLEYDQIQWLKL